MNFATRKEAEGYRRVWESDTGWKHRVVKDTRTAAVNDFVPEVRWGVVLAQPMRRIKGREQG